MKQGRLYLYLGQREYISCEGQIDDIKGIAFVPDTAEIKGMQQVIFLLNYEIELIFLLIN